jgi:hypothetical protein
LGFSTLIKELVLIIGFDEEVKKMCIQTQSTINEIALRFGSPFSRPATGEIMREKGNPHQLQQQQNRKKKTQLKMCVYPYTHTHSPTLPVSSFEF